jgi:UDP-N-acetylglucosamine--N-acetylmuramyl-(pentapeptide) pyrophosphoryl-undecaprenol N-acetylglucosamine transferase
MIAQPIVILAGGTGGHIYPGLAIAAWLRAQGQAVEWVGTAAGLEARLVPAAGIPLHTVPVEGLRRRAGRAWLVAPFLLTAALARSLWLLRRLRPALVLAMGGFVSGPAGLAARLLGLPLLLHEQNARPGLTNRCLAGIATAVLEGVPGAFEGYGAFAKAGGRIARRTLPTGNPVRAEIRALPAPAARLAGRSGPLRLLCFGGSQGARALNETLPEAAALLAPPLGPQPGADSVEIWHQTGPAAHAAVAERYEALGLAARVVPYIENMAEAYAWADLVLCRAGASTVAELAAAGAAAILVPYPHAVDDHQTANARFLADADAALLLPEAQLSAAGLAVRIKELAANPARRLAMAEAARALAGGDAAARIGALCLEYAEGAAHVRA